MEEIKQKLTEASPKGQLPCAMAFKIARECNASVAEVGALCNELKIKVISCQLGCF